MSEKCSWGKGRDLNVIIFRWKCNCAPNYWSPFCRSSSGYEATGFDLFNGSLPGLVTISLLLLKHDRCVSGRHRKTCLLPLLLLRKASTQIGGSWQLGNSMTIYILTTVWPQFVIWSKYSLLKSCPWLVWVDTLAKALNSQVRCAVGNVKIHRCWGVNIFHSMQIIFIGGVDKATFNFTNHTAE